MASRSADIARIPVHLIRPVDKTAVRYQQDSLSYSELLDRINLYKAVLASAPASRVAIFSENRPEWIFSFYAAWYHGAEAVPIDHLSSAAEVSFILEDCRPDTIFCSSACSELIGKILTELSFPLRMLVFENLTNNATQTALQADWQPDPQKTALIIYTSGTTGSPKGVMLSFENIWANISGVSEKIPIFQKQERVLIMLPLHHTFPLLGSLVAPLSVGATVAITPSLSSDDIINTLQQNKITIIIGVPRFYNLIRKGIRDKVNKSLAARLVLKAASLVHSPRLSRRLFAQVHEKFGGQLKYLVCGGAAIDIEVARDFRTLGFEMLEGYGMTEAAPMITFTRPGHRKLGSAGQALPGTEITVRDNEIVVRGKNVMKGYYNRPHESTDILRDGWLYTGDMGYMDPDGFIFLTGRKKEIIVLSNGKNINPEETEKSLCSFCPNIAEAGVYAKNDQLHCIIVPDFNKLRQAEVHQIDAYFRDIVDRFNLTVSAYKKLMKITLIKSELPRTRLGKIQRFMLEDLASQESRLQSCGKEPDFPEYEIIKDYLAKTCDSRINPDDHLEIDLGIDSLDKVNLITFLQNSFGINTGESLFSEYQTVASLAEYCHQNKSRISAENVNWQAIFKENIDISLPKSWLSHHLFKYLLKLIFKIFFRLKGHGLDNLPETPCIITPNHQSFIDGFYITSLLKTGHLKKTIFFAKEKHLRKRWQKFIAGRHNIIIMDINKDLKNSLQKMAAALKKGKNIIIFPEGTRSKDGKLGRFKKFFAILSKELNVPVVPVIIQGAFEALPTGRHLPKFGQKVSISFSKPIFPENHTVESLQESVYRAMQDNLATSN